jgi:hypothetical protein
MKSDCHDKIKSVFICVHPWFVNSRLHFNRGIQDDFSSSFGRASRGKGWRAPRHPGILPG